MPRIARLIVKQDEAVYHVMSIARRGQPLTLDKSNI